MLYATVPSPLGELLLTAGPDGALSGLYLPEHKRGPSLAPSWKRDERPFARAREELEAWFAGELTDFRVPLAPVGTPFQLRVWQELRRIPYATTVSYGELARRIGRPEAARAVGFANGRNPISIIVPCHRVVGAAGALTGYAGGLARKRVLLEHEAGVARLSRAA